MIEELPGSEIFKGVRGQPPIDREALKDAILRVAHLMVRFPEIDSIDINPLLVSRIRGSGHRRAYLPEDLNDSWIPRPSWETHPPLAHPLAVCRTSGSGMSAPNYLTPSSANIARRDVLPNVLIYWLESFELLIKLKLFRAPDQQRMSLLAARFCPRILPGSCAVR